MYKQFLSLPNLMEFIKEIDQKFANTLPYYSDVAQFTSRQCKQSFDSLNNLYTCSTNKVKKVTKASKQIKKDILWMLSQTADDILDLMEEKFEIECTIKKEKNKSKRLGRVYNQLKQNHLMPYFQKMEQLNEFLLGKGRNYYQTYAVPLYVTVKATILVSRQIMMEMFAQRVSQLKMSYQFSKDTITMFWSGEFKEEKILEKVKENLGSFKQFTISFVQKGMEIKISRKDLCENYHHIMEKLAEIMKGVSQKSIEQWTETKTKTVDLYRSVLNRIREKQVQIRMHMQTQNTACPTNLQKNQQPTEKSESPSKQVPPVQRQQAKGGPVEEKQILHVQHSQC